MKILASDWRNESETAPPIAWALGGPVTDRQHYGAGAERPELPSERRCSGVFARRGVPFGAGVVRRVRLAA